MPLAVSTHPARSRSGRVDLEAAIKANAKIQATLLSEASTVISGMVKENKLKVVAGYYDLGNRCGDAHQLVSCHGGRCHLLLDR